MAEFSLALVSIDCNSFDTNRRLAELLSIPKKNWQNSINNRFSVRLNHIDTKPSSRAKCGEAAGGARARTLTYSKIEFFLLSESNPEQRTDYGLILAPLEKPSNRSDTQPKPIGLSASNSKAFQPQAWTVKDAPPRWQPTANQNHGLMLLRPSTQPPLFSIVLNKPFAFGNVSIKVAVVIPYWIHVEEFSQNRFSYV